MRSHFPFTLPFLILSFCFCIESHSQATYPSIELDTLALVKKLAYLDKVQQSKDSIRGPNIIIILVDDLGKNDITLYDPTGVETPNINQMAGEGIFFTQAYSVSAVCNPSRAGLLTGRYPQRFGGERQIMSRYAKNKVEHFVFKHFIKTKPMHLVEPWYSPSQSEINKQGLPQSELSLFEALHHAGYRTSCIGKWHLGYNEPFLPGNRNIDDFFGFYEAFSLYAPKESRDMVNVRHRSFQNRHIWRQHRNGPSAIMRNGEEVEVKEYLTSCFAAEACRFIRQHQNQPFFLYIPFNAPHTPFQAPEKYCEKHAHVKDKNKKVYRAMISALDDAIGEILQQVKISGIEKNTLIFFASDNGGATYTGATSNGDLNGGKITPFEGGLNVPFIMKWEGKIEPGMVFTYPVSLMDIFTTTVTACHLPVLQNITLDGVNILPYLSGKELQTPQEYLFWRTDYNKTVRNGQWKLMVNTRDEYVMLFDLESDREEKHNLKDLHPEIVTRLLEKLYAWERDMKVPAWPGVMEYEEEINGMRMRFAL